MTDEAAARSSSAIVPLVGFASAMGLLHVFGRGALAAPPLDSIAALADWATDHEPAAVAMAVVRLSALGVGYHLLFTTALAVVGRVVRSPRLISVADAMTLPMFRSTAGRLAGLAISASSIVGGALPGATAAPAPTQIDAASLPASGTVGPMLIERVALPAPPHESPTESSATIRAVSPPQVPVAEPAPILHRVEPGDHLWGIAEETLQRALGRPPSDAEVDPFWRQVILANPDLVDPDLIFPGQLVVVPPVSPPLG